MPVTVPVLRALKACRARGNLDRHGVHFSLLTSRECETAPPPIPTKVRYYNV